MKLRRLAPSLALFSIALTLPPATATESRSPDIILIVTDDQRFDSMRFMPRTRSLTPLVFTQALVANPVCCPSRATILSGRYGTDTGVWTNQPPYGGFPAFAAWDAANTTLPEALNATYHTGFAGKYFNAWDGSLPSGWDGFWGLHYDDHAGRTPYYGYEITGTDPPVSPPNYALDAMTERLTAFIGSAPAEAPMFVLYTPPSPHSAGSLGRPIPAPADRTARVRLAPLPPSANERQVGDKPGFIQKKKLLSKGELNRRRRATARTLLSTDRSIAEIIAAQEIRDPGLANTVIIFMSDNGLLDGEHRWTSKAVPYEEALRIPMRMYHPEIGAGSIGRLVTNADVPATIASIAGVELETVGRSLLVTEGPSTISIRGATNTPRAFCGLRTQRWKYVRYNTGEVEGYDLRKDPWEMRSRPGRVPAQLVDRAITRCQGLGMPNWTVR